MPMRGERVCVCGKRVSNGMRCVCQQQRKAEADARRPSARARGYDGKWQIESKAFLSQPENRHCKCGCGRKADMVDHIIPHRGDMRLFWNRANWQPCHVTSVTNNRSKAERTAGGVSQTLAITLRTGLGGPRQIEQKSVFRPW